MRRVGYDNVCFRDVGHHAAAGSGTLLLADAPFNVRIAFLIFEFIADVLPGHTQFFDMAVDLPENVKPDHRYQTQHDQHTAQGDEVKGVAQGSNGRLANQPQHFRPVVHQKPRGHRPYQRRLQHRFHQFRQRLAGKQSLYASDGVHFARIECQRFRTKQHAA